MEFRSMKLRGRSEDCIACSKTATISKGSLSAYDYPAFTGQPFIRDKTVRLELLPPSERISSAQFSDLLKQREARPVVLIDVRPKTEFDICRIKGEASQMVLVIGTVFRIHAVSLSANV